jgi:hypothetical protein
LSAHRLARGLLLVSALAIACGGCATEGAASADGVLRTQTGPFEGTLSIEPAPPHVGDHRVVVTLDRMATSDDLNTPVEGASVVISPFMPAHGHGSVDVEAIEESEGLYASDEVFLTMPGIWDLHVHVTQGELEGELIATIEVP